LNQFINTLLATRLLGIIRMPRYEYPAEVAQALVAGGLKALEFTLSGEGALTAVSSARAAVGNDIHIGAGTVLTPAQVAQAAGAGAEFIVTPLVNLRVIAACQQYRLPIICGAYTPTEIMTAMEAGAELIKLFPARLGGPQYIRDLLAPMPSLRLVPTGGVSPENAATYLEAGAAAVAIGGNLVSSSDVSKRLFLEITRRAITCVQAVAKYNLSTNINSRT
jgi:2-dehydro-3-deoxyphosphogluconate aldolase / (4S)-4-hydroxy-2-oxoglutarate aldolase